VKPKHIPVRWLAGLLLALACLYLVDYAMFRLHLRDRTASSPIEPITRTRVLAIPQKNGKFDYQIDQQRPIETLGCVHALFPHSGYPPCWYLKPRVTRPIQVQ